MSPINPPPKLCALASGLALLTAVSAGYAQDAKPAKTFIDYFQPMPIIGALTTNVWGAATVGPRDTKNGLEDVTMSSGIIGTAKL